MDFLIIFWNMHIKMLFKNYVQMDLRKMRLKSMNWFNLAQDRDQQWALVNMLMSLWVSQK